MKEINKINLLPNCLKKLAYKMLQKTYKIEEIKSEEIWSVI